jgi:hypothetical protein
LNTALPSTASCSLKLSAKKKFLLKKKEAADARDATHFSALCKTEALRS